MTYPKTMYKAQGYSISTAMVVSESAKFLTISYPAGKHYGAYERKEAKESQWHSYFETWEDAKAHIVAKQEKEVIGLRAELERANGRLGQLRGIKKPEES